ncbi:MAG: porin family protein [Ferruginibacter sp.]
MKKNLSLLLLSLLLTDCLFAQFYNEDEFKKFGFRAGAITSHMNFSRSATSAADNIETSRSTGFTAGFVLAIPLADNLSLQPEYMYVQTGGTIKSTNTVYKFSYLSLPVFLKYSFEKFAVVAGPQFDLLIDAKKSEAGTSTKITHDVEERNISVTGGVEYEIIPSLSVNARYIYGLNNIGLAQRTIGKEFKYEMVQLTACIRF